MAIAVESLKSISYFDGLRPDELEAIRPRMFEKTVERGQIIIFESEPTEALFVVISGVLKIFKTSAEGKEQILNILRPGDSFNEVSVFDDGVNLASVQTMAPVLLYGLRKDDIKTILREHPRVALNIILVLASRVRQLTALVEDLSFRHVIARVAKILLEYTEDDAAPRPRLTQQEMASMAGTAREVVARSLKAMENDGAIKFDHHRLIIADRDALAQLAEKSI